MEIEHYGDPDKVPPMQTYAILDAAKIFGLPEMLDTSRLEHRCLFKGDAYDDLKNVAPWIVRLDEDSDFTAKLFTPGKPPWCMWDKEPGIYIRSRAGLDALWKHFRKFIKVQNTNETWYFFRFWENGIIKYYLEISEVNSQKYIFNDLVYSFVVRDIFEDMLIIRLIPIASSASAATIRITNANLKAFQKLKRARFCRDTMCWLQKEYPEIESTQNHRRLILDEMEFLNAHDPNCDQNSAAYYLAACWLSGQRLISSEHFTKPGGMTEKRQYFEALHTKAHKQFWKKQDGS
ncbi:DUF4123 domain-containing protein [Paracoccus sp. (in: a-proteobacteria)]|uniref:DUF4123 domain-containing protein n=1 Tax=Paracoccus sp. TaxID=267 RepID=UPI003A853184